MLKRIIATVCGIVIPLSFASCTYVGYDEEEIYRSSTDVKAYIEEEYPEYEFTIVDVIGGYTNNNIYQSADYDIAVVFSTNPPINGFVLASWTTGLGYGHYSNNLKDVFNSPSKTKIADVLGTDEFIYDNSLILTKKAITLSDISADLYQAGITELFSGIPANIYDSIKAEAYQLQGNTYYSLDAYLYGDILESCVSDSTTFRHYIFSEQGIANFALSYNNEYYLYNKTFEGDDPLILANVDGYGLKLGKWYINYTFPSEPNMLLYSDIEKLRWTSDMVADIVPTVPENTQIGTEIIETVPENAPYASEEALLAYLKEYSFVPNFTPVSYSEQNGTYRVIILSDTGVYYECYSDGYVIPKTVLLFEYEMTKNE